jgi:hypothetical protein
MPPKDKRKGKLAVVLKGSSVNFSHDKLLLPYAVNVNPTSFAVCPSYAARIETSVSLEDVGMVMRICGSIDEIRI